MVRKEKNTVNQPSRANQEYVMVNGVKKRNIAYQGKNSTNKTSRTTKKTVQSDFSQEQDNESPLALNSKKTTMKAQKQYVRDNYDFGDKWSEDFFVNYHSSFMEARGGIVGFNKPTIQKEFWIAEYGHDFDEKQELASDLSSDVHAWVDNNMNDAESARIHSQISDILNGEKQGFVMMVPSGDNTDELSISIETPGKWNTRYFDDVPDSEKLSEEEMEEVLEYCERDMEKFQKRINTYLKKYGMPKYAFRTFWGDR